MMASVDVRERSRRQVPPYASFLAFESFVRRAGSEGLPLQVDKSLLIDWGIATGNESGVLTTLRGLGIIDAEGRPSELYREMRLSQPRRVAAFRRAAEHAYPGLTSAGEKLDENQLYDYFVEERGLTGQMVDKAIRFYRQLVDALGRDLAPLEAEPAQRAGASSRPTANRPASVTAPPARQIRALPVPAVATTPRPEALQLSLVVQVSPNATEEELTNLFLRLRRAWHRSQAEGGE
jgi:hypothetical protein